MPSVPPAPGLGPLRALERQRPLPDPAGLPPSLPFSLHYTALRPVPLGRRVRGWGRGRRGAGEPRQGFLPKREHPSDRARSAAGTAGLGRLPRTRIAPPPRPEPPDPSVAPSCGAGTRGQAPRGREEAAPAGLGGAGRGRLPGPARRGLGSGILSGRTKAAGEDLAPPNPHPRGLTLNLNLYLTLSGRWRGNPSDGGLVRPPLLGRGRTWPLRRRREGAPTSPGALRARCAPKRPWARGSWGSCPPPRRIGVLAGRGSPARRSRRGL